MRHKYTKYNYDISTLYWLIFIACGTTCFIFICICFEVLFPITIMIFKPALNNKDGNRYLQ
jgi:hypothetical protein